MSFFRTFVVGFQAKWKERLFCFILGLAIIVHVDMYKFNALDFLQSFCILFFYMLLFLWLDLNLGMSLNLVNSIAIFSWMLVHYNPKLLNYTEVLCLCFLALWLGETFFVHKFFKK